MLNVPLSRPKFLDPACCTASESSLVHGSCSGVIGGCGMLRKPSAAVPSKAESEWNKMSKQSKTFIELTHKLEPSKLGSLVSIPPLGLHPGRLTWNLKMDLWKAIFLYDPVVFRFHVNLPVRKPTVWPRDSKGHRRPGAGLLRGALQPRQIHADTVAPLQA